VKATHGGVDANSSKEHLYRLARNAFEGAWLDDQDKAGHLNALGRVFAVS
jgi:adenosine deaminase